MIMFSPARIFSCFHASSLKVVYYYTSYINEVEDGCDAQCLALFLVSGATCCERECECECECIGQYWKRGSRHGQRGSVEEGEGRASNPMLIHAWTL